MEKGKARSKLAHFWYYYKWHTLGVIFAAVVLAVGITQCASRPKPDVTVVLYMDEVVSDNRVKALEEALQEYAQDTNGNGRVEVQVTNLSYPSSGGTRQAALNSASLLLAQMTQSDSILYICDEHGYDFFAGKELFEQHDELPDKDQTAFNWKGSALQKELDTKFPDELYFGLRRVSGTTVEKDDGAAQRERDAQALLNRVMKGEKTAPQQK